MTFSNRPYQDRGKKKWRGFMLSEHTASLEAEERKPQDWKEAMSQESIVAVLHQAVSQRAVLRIQIYKDLGESPGPDVLGQLHGHEGDTLYVQTNESVKQIQLDAIRHIETTTFEKWYV